MAATFTVEDGTGLVDSNAYVTVAFSDQHALDYGLTGWTAEADVAVKQLHIRLATQFQDAEFGRYWLGVRRTSTQALDWPRSTVDSEDEDGSFRDETVMPAELLRATVELAELSRSGVELVRDSDDGAGRLKRKRIKTGDIEVEKEWEFSSQGNEIVFPLAERILEPLLEPGGRLMRG